MYGTPGYSGKYGICALSVGLIIAGEVIKDLTRDVMVKSEQ